MAPKGHITGCYCFKKYIEYRTILGFSLQWRIVAIFCMFSWKTRWITQPWQFHRQPNSWLGGRILSSGSYGWSELGGWISWNYYHPLDTLALIAEIFLTTSLLWACRRPGLEPTIFPSGEADGPHLLRRTEWTCVCSNVFFNYKPLIGRKKTWFNFVISSHLFLLIRTIVLRMFCS